MICKSSIHCAGCWLGCRVATVGMTRAGKQERVQHVAIAIAIAIAVAIIIAVGMSVLLVVTLFITIIFDSNRSDRDNCFFVIGPLISLTTVVATTTVSLKQSY